MWIYNCIFLFILTFNNCLYGGCYKFVCMVHKWVQYVSLCQNCHHARKLQTKILPILPMLWFVLSIRHENKSKNAPETEIKEPIYPQFSKFNCVKIVTFSCKMHKISVTWSYNGIFSDVSNKSTWKSDLLNENRKVSSEHVAGVCQKCHFSRKRFLCVKSVIFLWNWNKKFVYLSTQWRF